MDIVCINKKVSRWGGLQKTLLITLMVEGLRQISLKKVLGVESRNNLNNPQLLVAKSAWKFYQTNLREIYLYLVEYTLLSRNKNRQRYGLAKNNLRLNSINYMYRYNFHQGCNFTRRRFFKYCIGSVATCFLKFRKPFWFRSKKLK